MTHGPDPTAAPARSRIARVALAALAALTLLGGRVRADEIRVLSAGALNGIAPALAKGFEQETGHRVELSFGTSGELRQRAASEGAELVIASDAALDALAAQPGVLAADPRAEVGRTGIGIGVPAGAALPDVSTPEALRRTLLGVKSFVYSDPARGGTSGVHFAGVLERLGLTDSTRGKATLAPSGLGVSDALRKGEAELGVTMLSELLRVEGVQVVGPLPRPLQQVTVYSAAMLARARTPELGRAFIAYLTRPSFREKFAEAGLAYAE